MRYHQGELTSDQDSRVIRGGKAERRHARHHRSPLRRGTVRGEIQKDLSSTDLCDKSRIGVWIQRSMEQHVSRSYNSRLYHSWTTYRLRNVPATYQGTTLGHNSRETKWHWGI